MKETKSKSSKQANIRRVQKLMNDHYSGDPWIDVNINATLKSLTAKQAAEKYGELNSIWQLVNHMISWRKALLARVMDKPVKYSRSNFISEIRDNSPKAWKQAIRNFETSQKMMNSFLKRSDDKMLETISNTSGYSYYELLLSIALHDTYHLGQIILIKKLISKNA